MKTLLLAAVTASALAVQPVPSTPFHIVPQPVSVSAGRGAFIITAATPIVVDAALRAQGRHLATMLAPATGFDLSVRQGPSPSTPHIALRVVRSIPDEGYRLTVTPRAIRIDARSSAGAYYALQTLRQLLPVEVFRDAVVRQATWAVPAVTIDDAPRFTWRGGHLDVSRHFMPKEFVKKFIDLLAMHKMNRFHWHLTDDQGWRLEITQYPRLTDVGAWRDQTLIGRYVAQPQPSQFDGKRHGGFYTQDDAREIVAYGAERFVTVVPEIEMPGHSQEVVAAYPELGSTDEPVQVRQTWAVSPYILNAEPATVAFMQNVLAEVMEIFPSPWIHVGGDEATKTQWKASPAVQARIKALGLKDEDALQSWFIQQMDTFLTSRGRRLIGWDEILDGGLAENATVMSWRGTKGAVAAAQLGHDTVLTPTDTTYFDYYQSRDTASEPLAIGGFLPLDKVYSWEPLPAELTPAQQAHVLGVQGQLWSEYLPNPKAVEYMAYPRMSALAEVAWTPAARREWPDFLARLAWHVRRLAILDVNFRPLRP